MSIGFDINHSSTVHLDRCVLGSSGENTHLPNISRMPFPLICLYYHRGFISFTSFETETTLEPNQNRILDISLIMSDCECIFVDLTVESTQI